jgi:DNA-binding transcriptional ArsR family regulator
MSSTPFVSPNGEVRLSAGEIDTAKAESELRGSTLRVYWYVFKKGEGAGVREIQRALGMASPSTALHHLEKLRELGLVEKDKFGQYVMVREVKLGTLRFFTRLGSLILPRYLFYAAFFTTALLIYLCREGLTGSMPNPMTLIFGLGATVISWYETLRIWSERFI